MKSIFGVIFCVAIAAGSVLDEFNSFKLRFSKNYVNEKENAHRLNVFANNLQVINNHNNEADEGKHTFRMGVNQFTDLTEEEWKQRFTPRRNVPDPRPIRCSKPNANRPDSIDWREE